MGQENIDCLNLDPTYVERFIEALEHLKGPSVSRDSYFSPKSNIVRINSNSKSGPLTREVHGAAQAAFQKPC
jgi:hypothetical protein